MVDYMTTYLPLHVLTSNHKTGVATGISSSLELEEINDRANTRRKGPNETMPGRGKEQAKAVATHSDFDAPGETIAGKPPFPSFICCQ